MFKTTFAIALLVATTLSAACPADNLCNSCSSTTCNSCLQSWNNAGTCAAPTTAVAHCAVYSSATACAGCVYGKKLTSTNTCVNIVLKDCLSLVSDSAATEVC